MTPPARGDFQAAAALYRAWATGIILMVVSRRGGGAAAELVFRTFRRQHREKFLSGAAKLGLIGLPAAVLSAQYHYLSNLLGGVRVEYMRESDRKAWIRYPPPRWMWHGTAICGIPSDVSKAMLRGWHAENGVTLGNPRLGFVCTKQTVDGQDALEGYFLEHERDLRPGERLRFAPGEEAPPFDPAAAPRLPEALWSPDRRDKAARNYAMEYVRSILPELLSLFGPAEARFLGGRAAYLVGLQHGEELKAALGIVGNDARSFADFFVRMARAQGDDPSVATEGGITIRQEGWRLMRGLDGDVAAAFSMWNALWEGCLAAHHRALRWQIRTSPESAESAVAWRLG